MPIVVLLAIIAAAATYFVVRDVFDRRPPRPAVENRQRMEKERLERVDRIIEGIKPVR